MMKAELVMLLATIAVRTSPMSAQTKFQVTEVDQILTNPVSRAHRLTDCS